MERFIGYLPVGYAVGIFILGPLFGAAIAADRDGIFTTLMGGNGTFKQVFCGHVARRIHPGDLGAVHRRHAGMGIKPVGVRPGRQSRSVRPDAGGDIVPGA